MVSITRVSNAAAIDSVNAVTALLNVGGAGYLEIRTGTQPVDVSQPATGTLLATLTLSNPAFAPAFDIGGKARAIANAIAADTDADAVGTATWFRAYSGAGTAVIDGNVGLTDEALILNVVDLAVNDNVSVSVWYFEQSET